MLLVRIFEDALGLVILALVIKEVLIPLYTDKPLFPLLRRTAKEARDDQKGNSL